MSSPTFDALTADLGSLVFAGSAPARKAQEWIGEVSSVAHESIDGALVVKTLGREEAETQRLAEKAERGGGNSVCVAGSAQGLPCP